MATPTYLNRRRRSDSSVVLMSGIAGAFILVVTLLATIAQPSSRDVPVSRIYGPMDRLMISPPVGSTGRDWSIVVNQETGNRQWQQTMHWANGPDMVTVLPLDEFPLPTDPPIDLRLALLLGIPVGGLIGATIGASYLRRKRSRE